MHDAFDLGLDPAVPVQRPVHAARHQGFVVEPGHGGANLAAAAQSLAFAIGQQPVAARDINFTVENDACAVASEHGLRLAHVVEHLGHHGGLAVGHDAHALACLHASGGHAAPEHATAL
ncbi:hypothetical protein D9M68_888160 [compost metagenome]